MRIMILPFALILPIASSAAAPAPAPQAVTPGRVIQAPQTAGARPRLDCPSAWDVYRAQVPEGARAQRLGELPPGQLVLAVERHVDGCPEPAIVRSGIGGGGDANGRPPREERTRPR